MDPLEPTEPKRFPKLLLLVVVMVIALVLLGWPGYAPFQIFSGKSKPEPYSKVVPPLSQESLAELPLLFPRQFILGKNPEIVSATTTERTQISVSISVRFKDPNNTIEALVAEYEDYAPRVYWSFEKMVTGAGDSELRMERGFQKLMIRVGSDALEQGIWVNIDYYAIVKN